MDHIIFPASFTGSIFLLAGSAKLAAIDATIQAMVDEFGVWQRLARPVILLSSALELTVGAFLLTGLMFGPALSVAAVMAVAFLIVQIRGLTTKAGTCHCFGALDVRGVQWPALARAFGVGVGVAGTAAAQIAYGATADAGPDFATAAGAATGVAFVLATMIVGQIQVLRRSRIGFVAEAGR